MKSMIVISLLLITITACQNYLSDDNILELYHNYSFISKYATTFNYYFYTHCEAGNTISFKIVYTHYYLCSSFYIYNDNTRLGTISGCYGYYHEYELQLPDPAPSILKFQAYSSSYDGQYQYFVYIYNKGYNIPLKYPDIILNNLIFKDLQIPYAITDLSENRKLIIEAKIEYPQYGDCVQVDINQNSYNFNESKSSVEILLEKDYSYKIKLTPKYNSLDSWFTYILIYFAEERNFNTLFYSQTSLSYTTMLSNQKWYIIDSVNSINDYNKYTLSLIEGFSDNEELKYNIKVKRYKTNDISYIKNNLPQTDDEYEEIIEPIIKSTLNFTVCEKSCLNVNTILIVIELNYDYVSSSPLYKYSINKIIDYKELEFKSYDISWYTHYEFKPLYVRSKDTIFISTNHSKTISHYYSDSNKLFNSFYNGQLYISYPDQDSNRNQVKILYSDNLAKMENDEDIGSLEIYRFNSLEMSFNELNLDDSIDAKFFAFELKNNLDKYFYIKAIKNIDYYIFYEGKEDYSFFGIESMPVYIRKFALNNIIDDITLMTYKNEYIMKIGYTSSVYSLINLFIIKNEDSEILYLKEGNPKIYTFSKDKDDINIELNLLNDDISYISLRIPSKKITGNLYVIYSEQKYILNNEGLIINNLDKNNKIILNIKNEDKIDEDIPILIKSIISPKKVISLSNYNRYKFEQNNYGIIKFKEDKTVNMKFRTNSSSEIDINYYYCYLSEDLNKQIYDIVNPELYDKTTFNEKEYNFEIKTNIDLEQTINSEKKYLYLIFSVNDNVEVSTGDIDILYNNYNLFYSTIYSDNKWYIIDSVNSIDNNNSYILQFIEGYSFYYFSNLVFRIKRYETNDITFIKNNIPISEDDYDEKQIITTDYKINFVTCVNIDCSKSKAILIQIDLNYHYPYSSLYTYEFKKDLLNQTIEFKSYDIKWYTNYLFTAREVKNTDTIFISTKYPNTIYLTENDSFKQFKSFYNGLLLVSLPSNDNRHLFNFVYSDQNTIMQSKEDIGHIEIFKFDSQDMSFEQLTIDNSFKSIIYNYEIMKNNGKYYYIKINGNDNYYIFYDGENNYSTFKIQSMPVDILQFSNNNKNDDFTLISNKGGEYILKIGNPKFEYHLFNLYIIKEENTKVLDLEEGKIKMITYTPNKDGLTLELNIIDQQISEESYINLKISSKNINGNLYISYGENLFALNNTGININLNQQNKIIINIKDNDGLNKDLPILIKLGLRPKQFKVVNNFIDKFVFDEDQYGIIKYNNNKMIKMKFKMDYEGITFGYYNCYLSEDFIKDTSNIIHPELFNQIKFDVNEHNFNIKTEMPLERDNNLKKENLYLIFSFNGKVEVKINDFYSLYGKSMLSFSTILSDNTWYLIDTVNSIDNYNKYKLMVDQGNKTIEKQVFIIKIKTYDIYNIEYIKNNMPNFNEDYDEEYSFINDEVTTFSLCEKNSCLNKKAFLMEIKFAKYQINSFLYKLTLEKLYDNKQLEFTKYDINWYTNYDFSPIEVLSKDTIIISTNHSNSISINNDDDNYKKFESFCNGMLFISFSDSNSHKNKIKISYSDSNIIAQNDNDIGHVEILKLNNDEATLDMFGIDELEIPKLFIFELKSNIEKYFYIKNNRKDNYYIFSQDEDEDGIHTFFKIEQMPIDAIQFSEKYYSNDILLMTSNNDYFIRIGDNNYNKNLFYMYIIKNEESDIIDLEEGKLKIVTKLSTEKEKKLQINFIAKEITNEIYVNLKIPQHIYNKELIVNYLDKDYNLNKTGVNIYNTKQQNSIILNIKNKTEINENIPIIIKFGIQKNNVQCISSNSTYIFNPGKIGIIKYLKNKTISMKLKPNKTNTNIYYYNSYFSEDYNKNISNIVEPKYYNSKKIDSADYFFEIKTELEVEKKLYNKYDVNDNINSNIKYLYLVFSFEEKTEVTFGEYQPSSDEEDTDDNSSSNQSSPGNNLLYIIICLCVTLIMIVLIISLLCRKKRNKKDNENNLVADSGDNNNNFQSIN